MAIAANSYGSTDDVASMTPRWGDATTHLYTTATRPTLAQVEKFIDRVSGFINVLLAEQGFSIPVSQSDAKLALDQFIVTSVADLCNYVNSAGRFFSDKAVTTGPWSAIQKEAEGFISDHAEGIAKLGAARPNAGGGGEALNAGVLALDFMEKDANNTAALDSEL